VIVEAGQILDVGHVAGTEPPWLGGHPAFDRPGFVLIATSFELEAQGSSTRLATETRVQSTDAGAARAFLPYWLAIRAGSGLIRRELLGAIARRARAGS
jgi:hypothetical protein